jgi:hypothetical protein
LSEAKETKAPREVLLRLLGTASIGHINMTLKLLNLNLMRYGAPQGANAWPKREPLLTWDPEVKNRLSSIEAAPLTTNRVALARLMGLKFLQLNGDTASVSLALPLLRDRTSIVRRRAADVLHLLTGEAIPEADPVKWEHWWNENRNEFERRHPNQQ